MAQTGSDHAPQGAQIKQTPATISGTVTDSSRSLVTAAVVTLQTAAAAEQRTALTDEAGSFRFSTLAPGTYTIKIAALGFVVWTMENIAVGSGDDLELPPVVLQISPASSSVQVGLPPHELAAEQLKSEEKQRLLGVLPNFFVTYDRNAAPLTAKQKFQLGFKTIIDPVSILGTGISAGIQQWRNTYNQFGQGMEGYGKRFGAQYADHVSGVIIGHVFMQSIFHQDPRYFYKGTGSVGSRLLYAIGTAFVAKGDNGHWQPDYSDVLGGLASAEISTLYYPYSSRTGRRLGDDVLLGFSGRATRNLMQEFIFPKLTTHKPKNAAASAQAILPEGTRVSLISIEDLSSKTAGSAMPITFVLASDIQVGGVVVAKAGSKASGQVSYVSGPNDGAGMQVKLDHVHLQVGNAEVPLRSTELRDGGGALEYHRLENSGRIAIVLYVAENVTLPPEQ